MNRRELGDIGEAMASSFFIERGYVFIDKQVRVGRSEIDLVVRDGEELVFVEVKTRKDTSYGWPEAAVNAKKFARVYRAAERYCRQKAFEGSWRIDVLAITLSDDDPIHHVQGVG